MMSAYLKSEYIVAFSAIFVSIFALIVSVYQVQIMQEEKDAAVWPYLEILPSRNRSDGLSLQVTNKGIGPALIKSLIIRKNGEALKGWREYFKRSIKDSIGAYTHSTLNHRVISPQETVYPFRYKPKHIDLKTVFKRFGQSMSDVKIELIYASVYGKLWRLDHHGIEEIESFNYNEKDQFE